MAALQLKEVEHCCVNGRAFFQAVLGLTLIPTHSQHRLNDYVFLNSTPEALLLTRVHDGNYTQVRLDCPPHIDVINACVKLGQFKNGYPTHENTLIFVADQHRCVSALHIFTDSQALLFDEQAQPDYADSIDLYEQTLPSLPPGNTPHLQLPIRRLRRAIKKFNIPEQETEDGHRLCQLRFHDTQLTLIDGELSETLSGSIERQLNILEPHEPPSIWVDVQELDQLLMPFAGTRWPHKMVCLTTKGQILSLQFEDLICYVGGVEVTEPTSAAAPEPIKPPNNLTYIDAARKKRTAKHRQHKSTTKSDPLSNPPIIQIKSTQELQQVEMEILAAIKEIPSPEIQERLAVLLFKLSSTSSTADNKILTFSKVKSSRATNSSPPHILQTSDSYIPEETTSTMDKNSTSRSSTRSQKSGNASKSRTSNASSASRKKTKPVASKRSKSTDSKGSNAKPSKGTAKIPRQEQQKINTQLHCYYTKLVHLKDSIGAKKAAAQITEERRKANPQNFQKIGSTTVCQHVATYRKVFKGSTRIEHLFVDGLITWTDMYMRSRKVVIEDVEAQLIQVAQKRYPDYFEE